jgi:hypothetical protein
MGQYRFGQFRALGSVGLVIGSLLLIGCLEVHLPFSWAERGDRDSSASVGGLESDITRGGVVLIFAIVLLNYFGLVVNTYVVGRLTKVAPRAKPAAGGPYARVSELFGADRQLLLFYFVAIAIGLVVSTFESFITLYLVDLGATNFELGLAFTLEGLSEIPAYLFGDRLIERFGPASVLQLGMVASIIRMVVCAVATKPWMALSAQVR